MLPAGGVADQSAQFNKLCSSKALLVPHLAVAVSFSNKLILAVAIFGSPSSSDVQVQCFPLKKPKLDWLKTVYHGMPCPGCD